MTKAFVDTDVVIRLLTGDDPHKQQAARALFERVEQGELSLSAPVTAIADAVYVLSSPRLYHLGRTDVRDLLLALLQLTEFRVETKSVVKRALHLFGASPIDFGDAMILASMERDAAQTLFSFDQDFDRYAGIDRREPVI